MGAHPGEIIWVLLLGTDYSGTDVGGVYSKPELAVAAASALSGVDYFELEAHRVDSDEVLPSFERRQGTGWNNVNDESGWRGTDAGIGYMLALCDAEQETP